MGRKEAQRFGNEPLKAGTATERHVMDNKRRIGRSAAAVLGILALSVASGLAFGQTQAAKPQTVIDYRIGPKDLLEITVFDHAELNQTVRVSEDGSITLSLLERVEVSGLTAQELEKKLAALLEKKYFQNQTAHVTVFIKEYQKVSVLGAVGRPGMYELVGSTTLLQMISQAGGFTNQAMDEIYIYRTNGEADPTTITISRKDLTQGNADMNVRLQPQDVINVPVDQMMTVYVYGEVKNPGAVQFLQSKRLTLLQAIAQAGGTTEWARKTNVVIKRKDKKFGGEIQIPVNLKKVIANKTVDVVLEEGDIIIVP